MGCGISSEGGGLMHESPSTLSPDIKSPSHHHMVTLNGGVILLAEDDLQQHQHTILLGRSTMSSTTGTSGGVHITDIGAMETMVQASPRTASLSQIPRDAIKNPLICLRAASPMPQREGRELTSVSDHMELSGEMPISPAKPSPILMASTGLGCGASLVSPNSSSYVPHNNSTGTEAALTNERSLTRKRSNVQRTTNLLVPTGRDDLDIASEARTPRAGASPRPNSLHATPLTFPTYLEKDGFEKDDPDESTSPDETVTEFVSLLPPRGSYSSIGANVRCPACHMELIAGARFCHECGKKVGSSATSIHGMMNDISSCSFSVVSNDPMTPVMGGGSGTNGRKMQRVYHRQVKIAKNAVIGKGTRGCVYKAIDVATGKPMAVKVMDLDFTDAEEVKNIRTELRHLSALRHPNVVEYFGCMVEENKVSILMERLECGTLLDLLQTFKSGIPEDAARSLTRQLMLAVSYCHGVGTTHRDIKPANILQSASGTIKLSDFGSAIVSSTTVDVNSSTHIAGTPAYMPPETMTVSTDNAASFERGEAHDIWSVGCTVHELLTGKKPWSHLGLDPIPLLFQMPNLEFPLDPSLSAVATDFLKKCLEKDIKKRPTAPDLLEHEFLRDALVEADFTDYDDGSPCGE